MKEKKIVFRCNGGNEIGWGHVIRCMNLAQWLKSKYKIYFVIDQESTICEYIKSHGFTVFEVAVKGNQEKRQEAVLHTIIGLEPHMVINDILDTTAEYMQVLKDKNYKIINFDDTATSSKMASVLIDANRKPKEGKCLGPKFIVISSVFSKKASKKRVIHKKVKTILFSFGGSDPDNLTLKALSALYYKLPENIQYQVVLGPSYNYSESLSEFGAADNVVFINDAEDLSEILLQADIAIVSGGVTMFEALALGTPSVVIAQNKAQAKNARKMEKVESVINLGVGTKISDKKIIRKVTMLLDDFEERERLATVSKETIDGKGLFRVLEQVELNL